MTTINISLPDTMKTYIEEQMIHGGYNTISEYFCDLIYQEQKRKSQADLESLLLDGLDSGSSSLMTENDWQQIRESVQNKLQK